jgi:diacylglycerol kinase family enzyme
VLRKQRLDLGDTCTGPILEPGVAEVVLDVVEAALTHGRKYRHTRRTAPWAERPIQRAAGPTNVATSLGGFLLVNPSSGSGSPTAEELAAEARALGIDARILQPGDDPAELARSSAAETLGVAGGDGSLAPVADVALERDAGFVCIPYGTRNHFARDLGLDREDPIGALRSFGGRERRIDVGRAGERLFLNNVSLGLYARLVHRREQHRLRREAFARVRAWAIVLTHRTPLGITIDGTAVESRLVLVANNAYLLELPTVGERERLDEGKLHLYVPDGDPPERVGERFVIDALARRLEAALDGEPHVLEMPVEFRIEPRALRVFVPATEGG